MTKVEIRERLALQGEVTRLTRLLSAASAEIAALQGQPGPYEGDTSAPVEQVTGDWLPPDDDHGGVRPNDLWYGWYGELAQVLYGTTGVPSHNQVMQDFTLMRDLLHAASDNFTTLGMRYQMPEFVYDLVKQATPILRAADPETSCPECGGTIWRTNQFPDAKHKPECNGKPSWSDLGLPS